MLMHRHLMSSFQLSRLAITTEFLMEACAHELVIHMMSWSST